MDNIIFKKVWQDGNLIELKISINSEFVSAYQNCYIEDTMLKEISNKISNYVNNYNMPCYLEFGKKEDNYTPAFSMYMLPADASGHIKIEVDIEILDNDTRSHRCCFFVKSELGLIENLGISLNDIILGSEGVEASLC